MQNLRRYIENTGVQNIGKNKKITILITVGQTSSVNVLVRTKDERLPKISETKNKQGICRKRGRPQLR